jgi:hypothetical protein
MRTVWLIPLAYVAGIEGFGWFVPYLLFVCAIATLARMRAASGRRRALLAQSGPQADPLNVAIEPVFGIHPPLELESAPA